MKTEKKPAFKAVYVEQDGQQRFVGFYDQEGPFLCVTGHSRKGSKRCYQPWYQIKSEVTRRGYCFSA